VDGLQVLTDAAKSLWRRYSAKAKELKQSVHMVSGWLQQQTGLDMHRTTIRRQGGALRKVFLLCVSMC
jgi:hypothetical protein